MRLPVAALCAVAVLAAFPSIALAHAGLAQAGLGPVAGLAHGFGHPLGGVDHILAMLAVGAFAAVLGGRALYLVPLSFIAMMVLGFALGLAQVQVPYVELGIAFSSIAIGAAAALGRPMPLAGAMALAGLFAIFHGHAHGAEMPASADGLAYGLGFLLATALLHLAGLAATLALAHVAGRHGPALARGAGALFAFGGIGVLAGWL